MQKEILRGKFNGDNGEGEPLGPHALGQTLLGPVPTSAWVGNPVAINLPTTKRDQSGIRTLDSWL
jgi:hypothetical protein